MTRKERRQFLHITYTNKRNVMQCYRMYVCIVYCLFYAETRFPSVSSSVTSGGDHTSSSSFLRQVHISGEEGCIRQQTRLRSKEQRQKIQPTTSIHTMLVLVIVRKFLPSSVTTKRSKELFVINTTVQFVNLKTIKMYNFNNTKNLVSMEF